MLDTNKQTEGQTNKQINAGKNIYPWRRSINALSLIHFEWDCLLIQGLLFGLVLHQGVYAGPDVGPTSQLGICFLHYLGN